MLPRYHIFFGAIFTLIIYLINPGFSILGLIIVFFSSFLIDVDHVIYYIIRKKDLNLKRILQWYKEGTKYLHSLPLKQRKNVYSGFYIFHGVEILIILLLLGIYASEIFMFLFLGFSFHYLFDMIWEYYDKRSFDKLSLIYSYLMFKKKKKR